MVDYLKRALLLVLVASSAWASYDVQPTPQPTFAYTPPTPVPTATPAFTATPQPTATPIPVIAIDNKSSSFSVTPTAKHYIVILDTTGGNYTATLPLAASYNGQVVEVKNSGNANSFILATSGADTIDGAATQTIPAGAGIMVGSNGISWYIL